MSEQHENTYDAIIIGAGIGGLVCGCYLAKAGMKVLIAEQHYQPGGYCTSFKRKGFVFDAAAHSFGGYRYDGNMNKILRGLDLHKRITIKRYDPSDIIISPEYKINFWADLDKTLYELQSAFPDESVKSKDFFNFLTNPTPTDFVALRKKTFKDLLDRYFDDSRLKALLSIPILGNGGLPPSLISAYTGMKIYTEFLLDGGYYPKGGMQVLPNVLAQKFKEFGGELRLSTLVKKIQVENNTVKGVISEKDGFIPSKYVISNCDAKQTFLKFLGKKIVCKELLAKLKNMIPSLSIFVLYLGIDKYFETLPNVGSNVWFLPYYDIENLYLSAKNRNTTDLEYYMVRVSPDGKTILAFVNTPFKSKRYWINNKNNFLEAFMKWIEKNTIPNLSDHIVYKEAATPYTMYRYTLNYKGAAYGWAGTLSQFADSDFKKPSFIQGLFLTGHWTTYAQGIPGVAYQGYDTAKFLLKHEKLTFSKVHTGF